MDGWIGDGLMEMSEELKKKQMVGRALRKELNKGLVRIYSLADETINEKLKTLRRVLAKRNNLKIKED